MEPNQKQQKAEDSFYPISVMIQELKSEEVQRRVNSVQGLHEIASALGSARTRTELIPFLSEILDDEDRVLLALTKALSAE